MLARRPCVPPEACFRANDHRTGEVAQKHLSDTGLGKPVSQELRRIRAPMSSLRREMSDADVPQMRVGLEPTLHLPRSVPSFALGYRRNSVVEQINGSRKREARLYTQQANGKKENDPNRRSEICVSLAAPIVAMAFENRRTSSGCFDLPSPHTYRRGSQA